MWFKNLRLYRFTTPFRHSELELSNALLQNAFTECEKFQERSMGFAAPIDGGVALCHAVGDCLFFAVKEQKRVVPPATVADRLAVTIAERELTAGIVRKKDRDRLREEIWFSMLPQAFKVSKTIYGYIDTAIGYLVLDTASDNAADSITALLQTAIGALPVVFPVTNDRPAGVMTQWLSTGFPPDAIELGRECDLQMPGDLGSKASLRNQELAARIVHDHLKEGQEVTRLAMVFDMRLAFTLDAKMIVRRLKFLEIIKDIAEDVEVETAAARMDADLHIQSGEIRSLIESLVSMFGGEDTGSMGLDLEPSPGSVP